jgi:hydroxyacylglutathione hydrolase
MLKIQAFTFNPFSENTYVIWDDSSLQAAIVDPGCMDYAEITVLDNFLTQEKLIPTLLLNTHCHIDHVLGNHHVSIKYNLSLHAHALEKSVLEWSQSAALLYQLPYEPSPAIATFLQEGDTLFLGGEKIEVLFTPGHSPGSVTFVSHSAQFALVGDVIFRESIGRTDLPGGDFATLSQSIQSKIYSLPPHYLLYNGHGSPTDVRHEMQYNPFVKA